MAELKTKPTDANVETFLNSLADAQKRQDAFAILELMHEITGCEAKLWGTAIIGFGDVHYKYESGREGDWFVTGFAPRKQNLTIYINGGFDAHAELLNTLGKHKLGKGCLYINKLKEVDLNTLRTLIRRTVEQSAKHNRTEGEP